MSAIDMILLVAAVFVLVHCPKYVPAAPATSPSTRTFIPEPDGLGSAVHAIGAVPTVGAALAPSHIAHSMSDPAVVVKLLVDTVVLRVVCVPEALVSTGEEDTLEYSTTESPAFTEPLKLAVIVILPAVVFGKI
jgi:hypothetical protein